MQAYEYPIFNSVNEMMKSEIKILRFLYDVVYFFTV